MNLTLLLVLVIVFAFAVGHLARRLGAGAIRLTGVEFVVVGVLIGPSFGWDWMTKETLARLDPLVSLLLGLAGLVLGLRFRRSLRHLDATGAGMTSTLLTIVLVGGCMLACLVALVPPPQSTDFVVEQVIARYGDYVMELHFASTHLWLAVALGCAASVVSTAAVDAVVRDAKSSGPATVLLEATGTMAQVVPVLVLGLSLATARATGSEAPFKMRVAEWALASVGAALVSGLLFGLFMGRERDPNRIYLATVGLVTFASGVGAALGISPLFMNLLAGITVSATSPHAEQVRERLERLHHPLFVLLMVFAGAHWSPPVAGAWLLPGVYVVTRTLARRLVTQPTAVMFMETVPRARRLGAGLLSQGIMAVAIGLYASRRFPEYSATILTTVLGGILLSDLFADRLLREVLIDAGEAGKLAPSGATGTPAGSDPPLADPSPSPAKGIRCE